MEVPADWVSVEVLLPDLQMVEFSLYPHMSEVKKKVSEASFHKDTNTLHKDFTLMTYLPLQGPTSTITLVLRISMNEF